MHVLFDFLLLSGIVLPITLSISCREGIQSVWESTYDDNGNFIGSKERDTTNYRYCEPANEIKAFASKYWQFCKILYFV